MRIVVHPGTGVHLEFPDCRVCNDRGQVTCPCVTYRGELYLGHGPCDCSVCRDWPEEMKAWADRRGPFLPGSALKAKLWKNTTILACRFCDEGRLFHAWIHTPRSIGDKGAEWRFTPKRARHVPADSAEGRALLEEREEYEERPMAHSIGLS